MTNILRNWYYLKTLSTICWNFFSRGGWLWTSQ